MALNRSGSANIPYPRRSEIRASHLQGGAGKLQGDVRSAAFAHGRGGGHEDTEAGQLDLDYHRASPDQSGDQDRNARSFFGRRFILGAGAGWSAEEMADYGIAFEDRWKWVRECVLAMRQIWGNEIAEFDGEMVKFPPMWCGPKPVKGGKLLS
ncbi:LLM class flavin-dependent oxidoreductase [Sphingobium sp. AN558]|uniref:LLM class flavin-dependent oxidoreductase n=1 Tax=Sphingobium sp. AN558 TaxID=3133442 RepID=UPI0030BF7C95